jgi:antitoxin MazE
MIKRLTQVGNSLGLLIDRPILQLLGIDRETLLEISTDGAALIVRPAGRQKALATSAPPRQAGGGFID